MTRHLTGLRFGRLVVVSLAASAKAGTKRTWKCRCDCGGESVVRSDALTTGNTQSCGCLVQEHMSKIGKTNATHRLSRTPEYQSWSRMIHRCYFPQDKGFKYWGGLGVTVCERWRDSFEAFLADMGPKPSLRHSIDRYPDNCGNYEPDNCRWATPLQQRHNRRDSAKEEMRI